jgi:hypothetical protein
MSASSVSIPAILILMLAGIGISPTNFALKNIVEINCVATGLLIGLPFSVSIFPPVSIMKGKDLEADFHSHEKIYFNKGL